MPALGLSAGLRKARELGRRTLSLALARPHMVQPRARYQPRAHDAILILQRGDNPSTDYYLRPRLEASGVPSVVVDLSADPRSCALLQPGGAQALMVVFCRYAQEPWLRAIEGMRDRLARAAFFMDDDLPAMLVDPTLPRSVRGKVALHFASHVERLGAVCSEVWVSTSVLAERYAEAHPAVLQPIPEADPPEPSPRAPPRVAYHGTDVHGAEQRFVMEIARRLQALAPEAVVELIGGPPLARACAGLGNVAITPQASWAAYRERLRGETAALSLAPLAPSEVNDARAPVKVFDAARLGAAGIYADAAPYRGAVADGQDGLLLPMAPDAWAAAVAELLQHPQRRLSLARAARARLLALRAQAHAFPAAPDA